MGMKRALIRKLVTFPFLFSLIAGFCLPASSQVDSSSAKWEITSDLGALIPPAPLEDRFGYGKWEPRYSLRVGLGKEPISLVWVHFFLEYRRYKSPLRAGELIPSTFERSYSRSDIAFYVSGTAFGFIQTGIGGIAQTHEEMKYFDPVPFPSGSYYVVPSASRFKFFYMIGIKYNIPVIDEFYVPIGVSSDMFLGDDGGFVPMFRLGLSKRF